MMHRTHIAGLLAIAFPWSFGWPPALALCAGGLGFFASVTGWVAALAALLVLQPRLWPFVAGAAVVGVWCRLRFPPGALPDTVRTRILAWAYLLREMTWRGHGWGSARLAVEVAWIRSGGRSMEGAPVHNEFIELLYEHGVWAGIGLAIITAVVVPHLTWGGTLSASVVAATVVMSATSPLRALWRWLRGERGGPLWGPKLLASLTVHVQPDGTTHVFGGLHVPTLSAEEQLTIARGLMSVGRVLEHSLQQKNGHLVPAPAPAPAPAAEPVEATR